MKQTEPFPNRALSQEHLQKEDRDVWKPFFLCFWCLLLAAWFCGNRLQRWLWLCHTAKDSLPQAEGTRFCQGLENGLAGTLLEPLFMFESQQGGTEPLGDTCQLCKRRKGSELESNRGQQPPHPEPSSCLPPPPTCPEMVLQDTDPV